MSLGILKPLAQASTGVQHMVRNADPGLWYSNTFSPQTMAILPQHGAVMCDNLGMEA